MLQLLLPLIYLAFISLGPPWLLLAGLALMAGMFCWMERKIGYPH